MREPEEWYRTLEMLFPVTQIVFEPLSTGPLMEAFDTDRKKLKSCHGTLQVENTGGQRIDRFNEEKGRVTLHLIILLLVMSLLLDKA